MSERDAILGTHPELERLHDGADPGTRGVYRARWLAPTEALIARERLGIDLGDF